LGESKASVLKDGLNTVFQEEPRNHLQDRKKLVPQRGQEQIVGSRGVKDQIFWEEKVTFHVT
jgi:hypothetical protein